MTARTRRMDRRGHRSYGAAWAAQLPGAHNAENAAAAFAGAQPGELVLIAGRGAMPRLVTDRRGNGPELDDRVAAREALVALAARASAAPSSRDRSQRPWLPSIGGNAVPRSG